MSRYDELVDPVKGTVSRDIFVSDEAHRDELEHLFSRAWLFVGHECQIPKPGDFFQSRMGEESVLLCRDRAGAIHVFLNTCRHRGMKVCRYDEGNTPLFTCPYHAWSYSLDGKLAGVPMSNPLYDGVLDRSQWGLIEVAQLANYKGAIFATWDPQAPSFETYLGEARTQLDILLDCRDGRPGGSEVFGGIQKWVVPSNWKFGTENFMGDTYHNVSHRSVDLVGISPNARSGVKGRRSDEIAGTQHVWFAYPEGHGIHSMILPEENWYVEAFRDSPVVEEYFRHCYDERKKRLGPEKSRWVGLVGSIFPNTSFHARQPRALFVWHPHGPRAMEIWRFYLVDADAPAEVKDFLRHYYMRYSGPAGMTEQDDMENWNYATAASSGTIARRYAYNYQQSMNATRAGVFGSVPESAQMTEQNSRNFYARWADYVSNRSWDVLLGERLKMAVIVTGGTWGIGQAIALELAARGHDVVAFGLDAPQVSSLARDGTTATREAAAARGLRVDALDADVSDAKAVAGVVAHTLERYSRIDALVNNAAIGPLGTILDTSEELWDRIMAVNLKGPYLCCRAVLPHMIEQGGGRIVNIGSGAGWGKPNMFAYSTSKGGIFAFSAALAYDYFHRHIRVNTVVPGGGGMPTGMSLGRVGGDPAKLTGPGTAAGRPADGSDIANAVAFLLSPDADTISGTVLDVGCFSHQGGPIPQAPRA